MQDKEQIFNNENTDQESFVDNFSGNLNNEDTDIDLTSEQENSNTEEPDIFREFYIEDLTDKETQLTPHNCSDYEVPSFTLSNQHNTFSDQSTLMDIEELKSCIETLIFLSHRPISRKQLKTLVEEEISVDLFDAALNALIVSYQQPSHGIEIVEVAGGLQLRTKPGKAKLSQKLAKVRIQRLSKTAMETLAIIAFKQPIMKEEVDKIRGVDSSHFVRGLMNRKLIKISGRSDLPGRPMIYETTDEFLELFGLKDLSALPSLREVEQMIPSSQSDNAESIDDNEDPEISKMKKIVQSMKEESSPLTYDLNKDSEVLKDIRKRLKSISTTTPFLKQMDDEKRELEKQGNQANDEMAVTTINDGTNQEEMVDTL